MTGGSMFRIYARVVLVGFWGLLVGLVTVVGAAKALAATSTPGGGVDTAGFGRAGFSLTPLVAGIFGGLLDAGLASLGIGAVVMVFGTRFCISSSRART